jgi:flavoprotein
MTGARDDLLESIEATRKIGQDLDPEVTVLLSESGELVVRWCHLWA